MQKSGIKTVIHLGTKLGRRSSCRYSSGRLGTEDVEYDTSKAYAVINTDMPVDEYYDKFKEIPSLILQGYNVLLLATESEGGDKDSLIFGQDIRQEDKSGIFPKILKQIFDQLCSSPRQMLSYVQISALSTNGKELKSFLTPKGYDGPLESKSVVSYVETLYILQHVMSVASYEDSMIIKVSVTTEYQNYKTVGELTLFNTAKILDENSSMISLLHSLAVKDYKSLSSITKDNVFAEMILRSLTITSIPYFILSLSLATKDDPESYILLLNELPGIITRPYPESSYNSFHITGTIGLIRQVVNEITSKKGMKKVTSNNQWNDGNDDNNNEDDGLEDCKSQSGEFHAVKYLFENRGIRLANEIAHILKRIEGCDEDLGNNTEVQMMLTLIHRLIVDTTVIGARKDSLKRRSVTQIMDIARNTAITKAEIAKTKEKLKIRRKEIATLKKYISQLKEGDMNQSERKNNSPFSNLSTSNSNNYDENSTDGSLVIGSSIDISDESTEDNFNYSSKFNYNNNKDGTTTVSFDGKHNKKGNGEDDNDVHSNDSNSLLDVDSSASESYDTSTDQDLDIFSIFDLEDEDEGETGMEKSLSDCSILMNSAVNLTGENRSSSFATLATHPIQQLSPSSILLLRLKKIQKSINILKQKLRNRRSWLKNIEVKLPLDLLLSGVAGIPYGYGSDLSREQREEAIKTQRDIQQSLNQSISKEIQNSGEITEAIMRDICNEEDSIKVIRELLNERTKIIAELKKRKKVIKREIDEVKETTTSNLEERYINAKAEIESIKISKKQIDETIEILKASLGNECKVIERNYNSFKGLTDFIHDKNIELKKSIEIENNEIVSRFMNDDRRKQFDNLDKSKDGSILSKSSLYLSSTTSDEKKEDIQRKLREIEETMEKSLENHKKIMSEKEAEQNTARTALSRTRAKSLTTREEFKATIQELMGLYEVLKMVYTENLKTQEQQQINKKLALIKQNKENEHKELKKRKIENKERSRLELVEDRIKLLEGYKHSIEEQIQFMEDVYKKVYDHSKNSKKEVLLLKSQVEREDNDNAIQISELETKVELAKAIEAISTSKERIASEIEKTKREANAEILARMQNIHEVATPEKTRGTRGVPNSSVSIEMMNTTLLNSPKARPPWRRVAAEVRPNPRTSRASRSLVHTLM